MTTTDTPRVTIALVYAGRRFTDGGKIGHLYYLGDEQVVYSTRLAGASIGGWTEVDAIDAEGSRIYSSSARYLRREPDPRAQEWRAHDLETEARQAQKSLNTKASKVDPLENILAPLQELAKRLTTSEKRALAVRVLEVLR